MSEAKYWEEYDKAKKAVLYRLRNHPELQTTLRAIRLHKEKKISALKLGVKRTNRGFSN